MNKQEHPLETLDEIRNLMQQSTRFISLSGLSGIVAGITALCGMAAAYIYLGLGLCDEGYYRHFHGGLSFFSRPLVFFVVDAMVVLILALLSGIYFTTRNARRKGLEIWNGVTVRMLFALFIPLVAGGLFCLILLLYGLVFLIAPLMLVFYGLALINASKYTLKEVWYLGLFQVITGLVASLFPGYGLLFWGFGFGIMHIVYGTVMYIRYER